MFKKAKNIDTAFRNMRMVSIISIGASIMLTMFVIYKFVESVKTLQSKIYVLRNGKAQEAFEALREDNLEIEGKEHVKTFHHYFFTLTPDDRLIQATIKKALYLADNTAKKQYDNLRESNYYTGIVSGNISQRLIVDSVALDLQSSPYHFVFYGKQEITRSTSIVYRSLICEGDLREIRRSENNPHGFLIERWKIVENKDLSIKNR